MTDDGHSATQVAEHLHVAECKIKLAIMDIAANDWFDMAAVEDAVVALRIVARLAGIARAGATRTEGEQS